MGTVTFTKEQMLEILEAEDDIIQDNIIDKSRWSIIHEIIFQVDGYFYQTTYSVGATESQDEYPWQYDDVVQADRVEQVEKVVKVWQVIK